jgi:hypothetical protein
MAGVNSLNKYFCCGADLNLPFTLRAFLSINMPSMDSRPTSSETPPRRRTLLRFLAVSLSLLVVLVILFLAFASPNPQFTWMTPAQFAQANNAGLLTRLKYKLIYFAGPLMRYYHSHRPNILISANIFTSSSSIAPGILGAPFVANTNGMGAWVVSPAELFALRQALKTNLELSFVTKMSIQLGSGTWGGIRTMGSSARIAPGIYTNVGTMIDVQAKPVSHNINILLGASATEFSAFSSSNFPAIKTNFSAACRALIPDAGALVLNCRNADPANPTNYGLIISPVLVDATGKPIKP